MKLIPIHELIRGKRMVLVDDSIVRGTQLRETAEFLLKAERKRFMPVQRVRPSCLAASI